MSATERSAADYLHTGRSGRCTPSAAYARRFGGGRLGPSVMKLVGGATPVMTGAKDAADAKTVTAEDAMTAALQQAAQTLHFMSAA